MEFSLSFECSQEALQRTLDLECMNVALRNQFLNKTFGEGVDGIFIGVIAVGLTSFIAKKRRIKYKKNVKIRLPGLGITHLGNCISFDILPNYECFLTLPLDKLTQYVALLIYEEFMNNENYLLGRVDNFDAVNFLHEVDQFFARTWGYYDPTCAETHGT